jgi:RNA polymerase sigma-70 factor (ECF subfamily)
MPDLPPTAPLSPSPSAPLSPSPLPADPDDRFNAAFERHWVSVFRFALAWTNDWAAAEDLAQDAFVRLWTRRASIDWSTPILPWLLTTTHHLATDRFRRLRRAALSQHNDASGLDSAAAIRWLDLRGAMSVLTPFQRSALVLTAIVGLETEAVGQLLGTSAGGVRAAVSRARQTLRGEDA